MARTMWAGVVCLGLSASASQAALVAQWTFNNGDATDLVSTVGGYTLTATNIGGGAVHTHNNDGTITLGSGRILYTDQITAASNPTLLSNTTIWARVKFNVLPTAPNEAWYMGLGNGGVTAGNFGNISLYARHLTSDPNGHGKDAFARLSDDASGPSGARIPTTVADQYYNVAVVFDDGETNASVRVYVDGTLVSAALPATALTMKPFDFFMLGRGKNTGVGGTINEFLSFDEIRLYDEALTVEQLNLVTPVPVPEPASLGLAGLALAALALKPRRRR